MIPTGFRYAMFRLQRPEWVEPEKFEDAINVLRAARTIVDLCVPGDDLTLDPQDLHFTLLYVSGNEDWECWLRFRWDEPYANDLTVVVREKR